MDPSSSSSPKTIKERSSKWGGRVVPSLSPSKNWLLNVAALTVELSVGIYSGVIPIESGEVPRTLGCQSFECSFSARKGPRSCPAVLGRQSPKDIRTQHFHNVRDQGVVKSRTATIDLGSGTTWTMVTCVLGSCIYQGTSKGFNPRRMTGLTHLSTTLWMCSFPLQRFRCAPCFQMQRPFSAAGMFDDLQQSLPLRLLRLHVAPAVHGTTRQQLSRPS